MAGHWDEVELIADGFDHVYVELDWWDGRGGLVDIEGVPHYFERVDDGHSDEADEYIVWPASEEAVGWEREQWEIFVSWNQRYEAGKWGTPAIHITVGLMHATTS